MNDFREQCRRQLKRTLAQRFKYGFFRNHKPVLDDSANRAFETMSEYREWADRELPRYLGFKIVKESEVLIKAYATQPNPPSKLPSNAPTRKNGNR
ncbi:hypothetical protein BH10ACI2_BH10ACI2_23390 [soil metagenome]